MAEDLGKIAHRQGSVTSSSQPAANTLAAHGHHTSAPSKAEEDTPDVTIVRLPQHPLCQAVLRQLGQQQLQELALTKQQVNTLAGMGVVMGSILAYQLMISDLGSLFHRICGLVIPIFSIGCAFYWLALYLRKHWSTTSIYVLLCACFGGELVGQALLVPAAGAVGEGETTVYVTRPMLLLTVLLAVSLASIFSTLETSHSTLVIGFVSAMRLLACSSLVDLPQSSRPFMAYVAGVVGIMGAKYMETLLRPIAPSQLVPQEGKVPLIKRRRSSTAAAHGAGNFAHRVGRRTSLPALIQKPQVGFCHFSLSL